MRPLASCSRSQAVACLGDTIGFGSGCALLQSLSVADCKRVSDASLSALAKGCRRLRFLNLSGCDKVCILTSSVVFTVASWGCFIDLQVCIAAFLPCLLMAKGMKRRGDLNAVRSVSGTEDTGSWEAVSPSVVSSLTTAAASSLQSHSLRHLKRCYWYYCQTGCALQPSVYLRF